MRPIVNKAELIEKMKANREAHRAEYLQAAVKYREAVVKELRDRARRIAAGANDEGKLDDIELYITLPQPVEYTEQYDQAIAALEWHQGEQVELDQREFSRWVLNEWEWKQQFAANTSSYNVR